MLDSENFFLSLGYLNKKKGKQQTTRNEVVNNSNKQQCTMVRERPTTRRKM